MKRLCRLLMLWTSTCTLVQETVRAFTEGWYREVLTELPDIRDGFVYPMAGPGLGTKLQPERLTAADCERRVTKA
jgi:galactonate dehydratase